jgi:hypothetical protein
MLVAVLLGNLLTVGFLYCGYQINRAEKEQRSASAFLYFGFALMPLFMAAGVYLLFKG